MRVLLTANASYSPPKGGSTRSNLIWLADLVSKGHVCCVVCQAEGDAPETTTHVNGIEIRTVRDLSRRTEELQSHIRQFAPDWVLVSSEDVAHTLLRAASTIAGDRLIYLAHTPQWYPFGPASWHPDSVATEMVRASRAVVAIGHTTAEYIQQHAGVRASVIHPPIYGRGSWPRFRPFRGYVLMINPSVVKGIRIFLELARRFPDIEFAGLTGWGTTTADRAAMAALPNVRVLESVRDIDEVLSQALLLLMPSLWYEGFGLIAMEAMLRGLPVIASNSGGLVEAKAGTGFVIPVNPVVRFEAAFDETHMPRPVEVPQNIEPWVEALRVLTTDRAAWQEEAQRSRDAAEKFVSSLDTGDFERLLLSTSQRPMRFLLAQNSLYYPSYGGGDKSNRLLMQALAARGHKVRVVSRVESFGKADGDKLLEELQDRGIAAQVTEDGVLQFQLDGVEVYTVAYYANLRPVFSRQIEEFRPDIILTSTDDPGQLLFDLAAKAPNARVVYLIRATIAVPFGPDSSAPNAAKTEVLKSADGVVGVSEYVANYARKYGNFTGAVHVPISLFPPGPDPDNVARFHNEFVTFVNPCAVKGITVFLDLADRFPEVQFAAVPTWGTNPDDYPALQKRPNVTILPPVDNIDDLFRRTRVLLVPSVWAEARSRIVPEAMARGVPVISSDAGGLPEAHMGVDYVLPVNLIRQYQQSVDMNMVPVADVPPQDIQPWVEALGKLTTDAEHWRQISSRSRSAALAYSHGLSVEPFEKYLRTILLKAKAVPVKPPLSDVKKKLLALRLKQRSAPVLLAGTEHLNEGDAALVCLPWAGGGTLAYLRWRLPLRGVAVPVAARLPGRESRIHEPPYTNMVQVIEALGPAVAQLARKRPVAIFGHSMGAGIGFELCSWLIRNEEPLMGALVVSAARAPRFRAVQLEEQEPSDEELLSLLQSSGPSPQVGLSLLLPALRADTRLYRRYVAIDPPVLPLPIIAYGGEQDERVGPEHLEAWRDQTSINFIRRQFPGGHFYLRTSETEFLRSLRDDLAPWLG